MKKNIIFISVFTVIAIGLLFYSTNSKKSKTIRQIQKPEAIDIILNTKNHSSEDFLKTLDENFLITWANAIRVNQSTFNYNNNNYYSQGGKRIS